MKLLYVLPLYFFFLIPTKTQASSNYQFSSVCERFSAGKIDAFKTLEALNLNIDDYSIGVNNTAKIFCA